MSQLRNICHIHFNWNCVPSRRTASGAWRWNIHLIAFKGTPGAAHGAAYPGEICPAFAALVSRAAPWAAFAQAPISSVGSGSVEDRVTQLERISNAHSQLLTQLQQQLSDNQSDIDSLRGQIQENQYQLNQVVERQKQILLQIDSLSSGGAAAQSTSGDQSGAAASTTPTADAGTANAGAPVKSGDANTDYNAAIALVQDKSRQDDAMVAFQNFIKM